MTVSALGLLAAAAVASAATCGSGRECRPDEYCMQQTFCKPCDRVCSKSDHNFDPTTCSEHCFDYIISFFDRKNETELLRDYIISFYRQNKTTELLRVVSSTTSDAFLIAIVSLVILVILLVLALTVLLSLWLKNRKLTSDYFKDSMKKKKIESIQAVCVDHRDGSRKLQLKMPVPVPVPRDAEASLATAMTPLSTRHPAEDATLEYAAYDNPTMNNSTPNTTPKTSRTETMF